MPSLWFVVPAHGRLQLAQICLRQLRRTCDALTASGVEATAVVIACDDNLVTARSLGFATVERDNQFVSRRFNDGIQLALEPDINPRPADYVVPCGSDDWVDHRIFSVLPNKRTVIGFQRMSFVREDGMEIATLNLNYPGGSGIRIYPRHLLAPLGYRPADEDRKRGCDTSILTNLQRHWEQEMRIDHRHLHDRQIVDWKTDGQQLNTFNDLRRHKQVATGDPFVELAEFYPAEALEEMSRHYALKGLVVAA